MNRTLRVLLMTATLCAAGTLFAQVLTADDAADAIIQCKTCRYDESGTIYCGHAQTGYTTCTQTQCAGSCTVV